jgi:hypothetical protein
MRTRTWINFSRASWCRKNGKLTNWSTATSEMLKLLGARGCFCRMDRGNFSSLYLECCAVLCSSYRLAVIMLKAVELFVTFERRIFILFRKGHTLLLFGRSIHPGLRGKSVAELLFPKGIQNSWMMFATSFSALDMSRGPPAHQKVWASFLAQSSVNIPFC